MQYEELLFKNRVRQSGIVLGILGLLDQQLVEELGIVTLGN